MERSVWLDAGGAAQRRADDDEGDGNDGGQRDRLNQPAEGNAERPADGGQHDALGAENPPDVTGSRAQAAQDADLSSPLDDAHGEGADQPQPALSRYL
jgi:hypothetical protein